jgi:hypothetical protein
MGNHHLVVELARHLPAVPSTRRVRRPAAILGWLLAVATAAAVLVLETAGRYFP